MLDRLLHDATMINMSGQSYRLKDKRRAGILEATDRKEGRSGLPWVGKNKPPDLGKLRRR